VRIEAPGSKLPGIFDRKERCRFKVRSLTPPQAAGNALASRFKLHLRGRADIHPTRSPETLRPLPGTAEFIPKIHKKW
jgi:hypothetical protein